MTTWQYLLPRRHGDGTANDVGPPTAKIEGDVSSVRQGCPQMFESIVETGRGDQNEVEITCCE